MKFREANKADIEQMHSVRVAVKENPLPDPGLIAPKDYEEFMFQRGKGWICEDDEKIVGFAIVDLMENNVWALFIQPGYEGRGIGKKLHDEMIDWYFSKTGDTIWLGTAPNTRAEKFYEKAGWKKTGTRPNGEIKFEMSKENWKAKTRIHE